HKIKDEEMEGVDLSSWHVALNGAEPISLSTMEDFGKRFSKWGFKPTAMTAVYGLSEASLAVTFSELKSPPEIRNRPGTEDHPIVGVGRPLPGFEVEVRNDQGERLPELQEGQIWIKGPSLMKEYLDDPVATAAVMAEGWLNTGDLGFIAEQKLYVVGRSKEVLIFRGRNIAPHEVESALDDVEGVRRGCVAAVGIRPENSHSDELVLLVERGTEQTDETGLIEACNKAVLEKTGLRCHQVAILEPGTLPRTSSGKIRRVDAGKRFEAGTLAAAPEPGILGIAGAVVRSTLVMPRS
ncbi:MAG: AMP-binding protein, partial [Myxococcota bacterium]|nr:AMP-binding protein [Myxococcota bacterium]